MFEGSTVRRACGPNGKQKNILMTKALGSPGSVGGPESGEMAGAQAYLLS